MRRLQLTPVALEDLAYWRRRDDPTYQKIKRMIEQIRVTPQTGIGKPKPLKHDWSGYWSRRINQQHRLVYQFDNETVIVAQARHHYDD
jgi:toxin YoeB